MFVKTDEIRKVILVILVTHFRISVWDVQSREEKNKTENSA